jgi:hypothetical protein
MITAVSPLPTSAPSTSIVFELQHKCVMQPKNKSFFDKIIQQICRGKEIRSFIAERQLSVLQGRR